jgi:2,3-bisphosphoglycerate-independent phosphoglycerate mutase
MMKVIVVLLDGLGDRSYPVLKGQTPLQAAATPNLDLLANRGANGLYHAAELGVALPSETAHFLLLGYDLEEFPGRGLLEAVGYGVPFANDDALALAHLASVVWEKEAPILAYGRDEIPIAREEAGELLTAISGYEALGLVFRLHQTRTNDAVLVVSGEVSPFVSDCDPMLSGRSMARILPHAESPEPEHSERTAKAAAHYLSWAHRTLIAHPVNAARRNAGLPEANFLAVHRWGRRRPLVPFRERWGMRGRLIASGGLYIGIARELGLTATALADTDDPGADLAERLALALADEGHEFVHIHTKAADEASHTGDPRAKVEAISRLDCGLGPLVAAVEDGQDLLAVITADHSTPSCLGVVHSGEPVPLCFVGRAVRVDDVDRFGEVSAARGCLSLVRGRELMSLVLNFSNRQALAGHRLGPKPTRYWNKEYPPFTLTD